MSMSIKQLYYDYNQNVSFDIIVHKIAILLYIYSQNVNFETNEDNTAILL